MINENSQKPDLNTGDGAQMQTPDESMGTPDNSIGFIKPEVDEQHLMSMMADWKPTDRKQLEEKSEITKDPEPKAEVNPVQMTEKDYFELFFKIPKENASKGRSVYIRPEFHQKFLKLIAGLEIERLTIYAYVDNIIAHHFKEFDELIHKIYQDRNKPMF